MKNTASKLVLGIIGTLVIFLWFRYDYIVVGQGYIFRIDHFTQTTSVANARNKEWESIKELAPQAEHKTRFGSYDDLLSDIKPAAAKETTNGELSDVEVFGSPKQTLPAEH